MAMKVDKEKIKRFIEEASVDGADIRRMADTLISGKITEEGEELSLEGSPAEGEEVSAPTVIVEVHDGYATVSKKDIGVRLEILTYSGMEGGEGGEESEGPESEVYEADEQIPAPEQDTEEGGESMDYEGGGEDF